MKIAIENKQRIHDVLLSDMQRRIFKQYNERKDEFKLTDEDYDTQNTVLYSEVFSSDSSRPPSAVFPQWLEIFDGPHEGQSDLPGVAILQLASMNRLADT